MLWTLSSNLNVQAICASWITHCYAIIACLCYEDTHVFFVPRQFNQAIYIHSIEIAIIFVENKSWALYVQQSKTSKALFHS